MLTRKRSSAGEETEEETNSEDPGVLSGGRGFNRPQEKGAYKLKVVVRDVLVQYSYQVSALMQHKMIDWVM